MKLHLLCAITFLSIFSCALARFPTEQEVRTQLVSAMTPEQVIAIYGTPGGAQTTTDYPNARTFSYLAPVGQRTLEVEGYVGFKVIFSNGKLVDWQTISTIPSYDPDLHVGKNTRFFRWVWGLAFLGAFVFGLVKALRFAKNEYSELLTAYAARTIPTNEMPHEFRFINRDTTLQEVIDRLGVCSRTISLPVKGRHVGGFETAQTGAGLPMILAYQYDMPYRAAVILMPEYPFEPGNKIRAAYFRKAREDED